MLCARSSWVPRPAHAKPPIRLLSNRSSVAERPEWSEQSLAQAPSDLAQAQLDLAQAPLDLAQAPLDLALALLVALALAALLLAALAALLSPTTRTAATSISRRASARPHDTVACFPCTPFGR